MLAGLPAIFSAMVLPFDAALALPWVAVSWPLAGLGGYQIWRAQHPAANAANEIKRRTRAFLAALATAIAGAFAALYPQVPVLIVGAWAAVVGLGFLILALAERSQSE